MCRVKLWAQVSSDTCVLLPLYNPWAAAYLRKLGRAVVNVGRQLRHLIGRRTNSSSLWGSMEEEGHRGETEKMLTWIYVWPLENRSGQHSVLPEGLVKLQLHALCCLCVWVFLTTEDHHCNRTQLGAKEWRYISAYIEGSRQKRAREKAKIN